MVDDDATFAKALLGVTNQRLVRVLCSACRQAFKPDERLLKKLNLPVGKIEHFHRPPTEAVLDKKGNEVVCQTCQGTGYVGRVGVFELLLIDDAIKKMIASGAGATQIKAEARKKDVRGKHRDNNCQRYMLGSHCLFSFVVFQTNVIVFFGHRHSPFLQRQGPPVI